MSLAGPVASVLQAAGFIFSVGLTDNSFDAGHPAWTNPAIRSKLSRIKDLDSACLWSGHCTVAAARNWRQRVVLNNLDRYNPMMDVANQMPTLRPPAAHIK